MPKRTYGRAFGKSKRLVKRRRAPRRRSVVPRHVSMRNGFPLQKVVKMRYVGTVRLSPGLADNADYFFRCNSIYDPCQSGTGHQPYTHDTWQAIYNHYKVVKSSIKVIGSANTSTAMILGIRVTDDTTVEHDLDTSIESGKAHYKVSASDNTKAIVTHGYNASKMFKNAGKTTIAAQFGANPSEEAYFHVFTRHLNGSATGTSLDILVQIDYTVVMWELKELGQS